MEKRELLEILRDRFDKQEFLHPGLSWEKLEKSFDETLLKAAEYMEQTGGEPGVFENEKQIYLVDTSEQSPAGRRSLCLDQNARLSRKKAAPESSAEEEARKHDLFLMDEKLYFALQKKMKLDTKTSSWLETPEALRKQKGAIFGDRRYDRVFIYHNGADSYYSSRGFRAYRLISLKEE